MVAMGCVFSCFRVKDSSAPSSSSPPRSRAPPPAATEEKVVTRNRSPLSSLLHSEENEGTPTKKENEEFGTPRKEPELGFDLKELIDQAKFLKACGTLSETPLEIRKTAGEQKDLSVHKGTKECKKFRSWLTDTYIEELDLEKQAYQPPTPAKVSEEYVGAVSLEHTPSSCMTDGQNNESVSTCSTEGNLVQNATADKAIASPSHSLTGSSVSTSAIAPSIPCKNKSVRFDCEPDAPSFCSKSYSSEISSQDTKQSGSACNSSTGKPSPYPTPLKLSDEMQTPGTVFPAYFDDLEQGKTTRIRSQYVYSVSNPVESLSQWKALDDEDSNSDQINNHTRESFEQTDEANPMSEGRAGENSAPWLRAPPSNLFGTDQHNGSTVGQNFHCGRTPADRPILGMVAAHWNDDEASRISPKWWDGNGIPNSTNKYKEDQKVSWHATPFEERLEKALSEETSISQRRSGTPPLDFNEAEESDSAMSQLQTSSHGKPVISF